MRTVYEVATGQKNSTTSTEMRVMCWLLLVNHDFCFDAYFSAKLAQSDCKWKQDRYFRATVALVGITKGVMCGTGALILGSNLRP